MNFRQSEHENYNVIYNIICGKCLHTHTMSVPGSVERLLNKQTITIKLFGLMHVPHKYYRGQTIRQMSWRPKGRGFDSSAA